MAFSFSPVGNPWCTARPLLLQRSDTPPATSRQQLQRPQLRLPASPHPEPPNGTQRTIHLSQLAFEVYVEWLKRRRFPFVCPEPVLVKCSFLYINGSKEGDLSHRCVPDQCVLRLINQPAQQHFVARSSCRPCSCSRGATSLSHCAKTPSFSIPRVRLSRASLGKMFVFIYKWLKKQRLRTVMLTIVEDVATHCVIAVDLHEHASLFEWFPDVCPEPVLVK
jgi:hypothetical protein